MTRLWNRALAGAFTLLMGCAGVPAPAPLPEGFELLRGWSGQGLYRNGTQRVLVLCGSAHEMGVGHGELLADEIRTIVPEALQWASSKGLTREALRKISAASWPHVAERYKDELRGVAEGSGVSLEDLRLLHAIPSKFHCSGAAAARTATADGKLYHTRSLDYSLEIGVTSRLQNHALLIVRAPSDGIGSAVPAWAGFIGSVTGMNAAGITIGEMGSASRDESFAGNPMIFMVRDALREARTLEQALDVFRKGPRTCGFNFILGSGDERDAIALEVTRNEIFVSGFGDDAENVAPHTAMVDMVRRTNHFVGRNTAKTQRRDGYDPARYMAGSWGRYQQITEYLEANRGKLTAQRMIVLLQKYPKGHPCLHQAVMAGTDRKIWVAQAVDDRTSTTPGAQNQKFYEYDLRAILAIAGQPSLGITVFGVSR